MSSRLVFIDDPARLVSVPRGYGVVAVGPAVELAAERAGLSSTRLDDYVDADFLEDDGRSTYEELLRVCDALDRTYDGPASTHWHFRALKIVVDGVRSRGIAAANLVADVQATEALLMLRDRSLTLDVLRTVLPQRGVDVRIDLAPSSPTVGTGRPSLLRRLAPRHPARRRRSSPTVVLIDELYGIPPVAAELDARGADVRLFIPRLVKGPPGLDVGRGGDLRALFTLADIDLLPAAEPRLRRILEHELPSSAAVFLGAQAELRGRSPEVLLGSVFASARAKAIAAAARERGVPIAVSRHGELGMRDVLLAPHQDLDAVDLALCWGAFEEAFVARHRLRPVRTTVVGAPSMELEESSALARSEIRARLGIGESERVVLFVANDVSGDEWVSGHRQPPDSDYVRHQRAVLAALVETHMLPVVKPHPAPHDGALEAWAQEAIPRVRIVREHTFAELVHLADAVLLDFPSTSMVQALRGSARIYVIDHPLSIWEPGVRDHLMTHGVVFVEVADLGQRVRADAEAGELRPTTYSQEAREPFTASGPGSAASRAAEAVLELTATTIDL